MSAVHWGYWLGITFDPLYAVDILIQIRVGKDSRMQSSDHPKAEKDTNRLVYESKVGPKVEWGLYDAAKLSWISIRTLEEYKLIINQSNRHRT